MVHLGHLSLQQGKAADAEKVLQEALALFPDYHYALAGLGQVKLAQKEYAAAARHFQRRYELAAHPENLYDYADALAKAGRTEEARKAFEEFAGKALAESEKWDNSNRELVLYFADHARDPKQALQIAEREYARRKDVFTRDAYAWALFVNGRAKEAEAQYAAIRAVGTKDAKILARAAKVTPESAGR
jgi:tetratricopeptide (TPR) repeat protein